MRVPLRPRDLLAIAALGAFALAASGTHVVGSGETLSDIAADHGTTVRALVDANGIEDPNLIRAGQELKIPGGGSSSGGSTYVVEEGDTLGAIARKFGTSVRALVEANGITNPNLIRAGKELAITGGSGGGATATAPSSSGGTQLPGQRHLVQPGDTIGGIAARYGISSSDFVRWNGLQDGMLYATARLVLFDPGTLPGTTSASTSAGKHTVRSGENLGSIARKYGSTSGAVAKASGVTDVNRISVGQVLTIPAGGGGGGSAQCPVPGARFMNGWGFARSNGRAHAGIDLFAAMGTPVLAPASGWVDIATGTVGGHQFRLTDASGTMWFGSHLSKFGKAGQVSAGDVIGYVGDSGNARGSSPHLHFEVHPSGQAVNPYPLLRAVC